MLRVLPRTNEPGWTHLFYVFYAVFLFVEPAISHATWITWCVASAAFAFFAILYVTYLWGQRALAPWSVLGIAALGFAYWPFNSGASTFLIFAAALVGYLFKPRVAFTCIGLLLAGFAVEIWLVHPFVWYWAAASIMVVGVGGVNIHESAEQRANVKLRFAQEEIEHLAKIAERERIARDLHDVVGHTLSVIVLKSELASKLLERDLERARCEVVELEQIARDALAEVRHAIGGYRTGSLAEEFARARATLEGAGLHVEYEGLKDGPCSSKPSPVQETVLALVMREAVTNIVRHSGARNCRIYFGPEGHSYRLAIQDDGCGCDSRADHGRSGSSYEGNGLKGMRERIEAIDGVMTLDGSRGTRLSVTIDRKSTV